MAKINLQSVSVEFPIYNVNARSLKKRFIRLGTGGKVLEDANKHIVVNALDNLSLTIEHGDRVGLVGHNGAGKSTFLRLLANIYEPTRGQITVEGSISPMLDISQGIEAEFTGYENIFMRGTVLGLNRQQISEKITEIAALSELCDYLSMPLRTYSSGMQVRLAFAIAACIDPDILLIDEVFGAGDATFMKKAREKMVSLLNQSSIVVLASHSTELIEEFCNKALLLEAGRIKKFGPAAEVLAVYEKNV